MNRSGMRFTIFSRLMLGYLTVVVLVMAVSVYAILKMRQLNRGTEYILNIDNRILEDQKKLTDAILSQLRYERKFVITRDATFYKQFLSAKGDFDKYLEGVLSVVDTPPKKECLDKIKTHYEDYQLLINQEVKYVKANRRYRKRAYDAGKEKAADGILEQLEKLENYSRQDIRSRMTFLEGCSRAVCHRHVRYRHYFSRSHLFSHHKRNHQTPHDADGKNKGNLQRGIQG
jgi:two-component system sensor histidine kinase GlrK